MPGAQPLVHSRTILNHVALALVACSLVAACSSNNRAGRTTTSQLGVAASPRMAQDGQTVPKGGGRHHVGKAYKVAGKWYYPKEDPGYDRVGMASWYGSAHHGRRTANGEVFDMRALSAAHPTLPLPSYVRVTNLSNGRSIIVRVNDRGPFGHRRIIDVSQRTAEMLDFKRNGSAKVRVQYVERAGLNGSDQKFLLASFKESGAVSGRTDDAVAVAYAPAPVPQAQSGKELLRTTITPASADDASSEPQREVLGSDEAAPTPGEEQTVESAPPVGEAAAAQPVPRPGSPVLEPASGTDDRISAAFLASLTTVE